MVTSYMYELTKLKAHVRRGPRPRDHHSLDGCGENVLLLGRGAIPHGTVAGPRGHYGVGYRTRLDGMSCARTLPAGGSSMWSIEKESFVFLLRSNLGPVYGVPVSQ